MTDTPEAVARKTFPILGSRGQASIDWQLVLDHAAQVDTNHRQTVQRLAERGGLSWDEMLAVLTDRHWRAVPDVEKTDAAALCRAIEARYLATTRPDADIVRQLVEALRMARTPGMLSYADRIALPDVIDKALIAARAAGYGGQS